MDVMQDIDGHSSSFVNRVETFSDKFASTEFFFRGALDDSSTSSFVNSAAASVTLHTPSTTANSPVSHASADLTSKPKYQAHKHTISGKSGPKKRRCSEESITSRFIQDPSALDSTDYWLRFDSDNESLDQFLVYNSPDTQNVRSLSLIRPLPKTRTVGTTGDAIKVAPPLVINDHIDDSALDQALSDDDDLFSMALAHELGKAATGAQTAPPEAQERLYSTPLSWEQPRPGYHMNYMSTANVPLADAERQRLLAIALGTGQAPTAQSIRPPVAPDFHFEMTHSPSDSTGNTPEPKPRGTAVRPPAPSRKNSSEAVENLREKPKNSERAAHNDIERKYRTNLKDKIAELRDAVPSLRIKPDEESPNSAAGSRTAPKVSKGTVLTKATEYIHHLERRNRSVLQKNEELARRLRAFEQLVGASPGSNWRSQSYGGSVYNQRY